MKEVRETVGDKAFNNYLSEYESVLDHNFTDTELREIKTSDDLKDDFAYFLIQQVYKESHYKYRELMTDLDFTDDIKEMLSGISDRQLYLNWFVLRKVMLRYFEIKSNEYVFKKVGKMI